MSSSVIESQGDERRTADLRSLRRLITSPADRAIEELRDSLSRIDGTLRHPEELTALLVPVIADALRKNIAAGNTDVAVAIASIVDEALAARTAEDRAAVVQALAPSVAGALKTRHEHFPEEVAEELAPIMGAAIREQVRLQRDAMVDALYPIIGSTISKYMAEALRDLVENTNRKIERTFTIGGLMRRAKAKALGITEAELLLRDSLGFNVTAAFLIQKDSGLLMAQVHKADSKTFDADLVSGMLTAIRSFVNDWIARAGEASELDSIEYGRSQIMIEAAGHCYLAVVVEGEPSSDFVKAMRSTLAGIVARWDREIAAYSGKPGDVPEGVHAGLEGLLDVETMAAMKQKRAPSKWPLIAALILLLGLPLGWYFYRTQQNAATVREVSSSVATALPFDRSPVVVEASGNEVTLNGSLPNALLLRRVENAVLGVRPEATLANNITIHQQPEHASLVSAEAERIAAAFNRISGVNISTEFRDGTLLLEGSVADSSLRTRAIRAFERLPGIAALDDNLVNVPSEIVQKIFFSLRSAEIRSDQRVTIDRVFDIMKQYPSLRLRIIGHFDETGRRTLNRELSRTRAGAVREALIAMGVSAGRLVAEGSDKPVPGLAPGSDENRCVRFEPLHHTPPQ